MKPKHTDDVRVLNDGLHSKRRLNTIQQVFTTHDLKDAVLYHIILSGSQAKAEYQGTIKALIRHIRTKCRAEYMNAYEVGEEKGGLHCHLFVIIETRHHFPSDLLDVREGQFIDRLKRRKNKDKDDTEKKFCIRIEPPKNRMHGGAMFARMNTPAKLENCINWATYQLKLRSKEGVPGRETYSGSEFVSNLAKREAQRQKYRDALTTSNKPTEKEQDSETSTAQEQHIFPIGSLPGANQEGADSTSSPCMVGSRQPTGSSEECRSEEASCPSYERQSRQGATTYRTGAIEMTPAQRYIASLYEQAVDADMDVDEVRNYLLSQGVLRTPEWSPTS